MSFEYGYVDPNEMSSYKLLEPGEGNFKIINTQDKVSKAGNPMMVITFKLIDSKGRDTLYDEYLLKSDDEEQKKTTATKIYNILHSIGKGEIYGKPLRQHDVIGCCGKCIIKTKKSTNPNYPDDKSVIAKYISAVDATGQNQTVAQEPFDDDIPF